MDLSMVKQGVTVASSVSPAFGKWGSSRSGGISDTLGAEGEGKKNAVLSHIPDRADTVRCRAATQRSCAVQRGSDAARLL